MTHSDASSPQTRLAAIFSSLLKRQVDATEVIERESEPRWDSLLHIELVFLVEDTFDLAFAPEEVEKLTSSVAILEAVARARAS